MSALQDSPASGPQSYNLAKSKHQKRTWESTFFFFPEAEVR